ncbi:MAG: hypothetical protein HN411_00875 [Waddliaceae bacterium]|jgi:signal transduction histidine kinase|nr:hypothetical protein [Waddliaceae bacterium]MBT3578831.1 hypothetical protein [Waddliaceae bacterium]MBT4445203.1 hypothetical protein [Waddliaceae bacterium]MBT6928663.1 hypothetical protein [Waddliaceae bacterium]MBT7264721.1 hypothetical protein [Waddliaceae bacterium]
MRMRTEVLIVALTILVVALVITTTFTIYTVRDKEKNDIVKFEEREMHRVKENLKNYVDIAYEVMNAAYRGSTDREYLETQYGKRLKDVISVVDDSVQMWYDKFSDGELTLEEAQDGAKEEIRGIRYDNGTGYIWINDTSQPDTRIVMHPIITSLEGLVDREDEKWYCANGVGDFLFDAFIDVSKKYGEGFVDYIWTKPTADGLLPDVPKLSYVKLFEEWNWILGTGIYIDDAIIDAIEKAKSDIKKMRYDEGVGYFWINDTTKPIPKMIMHPTIPALDGLILDDPKFDCALGKDRNLFVAFVEVSEEYGGGFVDYLWPKPTKKGLTEDLPKMSYVRLYEPLGWVVGSGVYIDSIDEAIEDRTELIEEQSNDLTKKIAIITIIITVFAAACLIYVLNKHVKRMSLSQDDNGNGKGPSPESDTSDEADEFDIAASAKEIQEAVISEQAKLLAFNAAVESVRRQGSETGGNALIKEANRLAEENYNITKDISRMVKSAEQSAQATTDKIDNIGKAIDDIAESPQNVEETSEEDDNK